MASNPEERPTRAGPSRWRGPRDVDSWLLLIFMISMGLSIATFLGLFIWRLHG